MADLTWINEQARRTLYRLIPQLNEQFAGAGACSEANWKTFIRRLERHFPRLFGLLYQLYGHQYDFFFHVENLLAMAARMWVARPQSLKELDTCREAQPGWFHSEKMVGGVCYVDLFAGNLEGVKAKIPYFKELGLTYLHLMPLFKCPEGNNDGGYAVSSYREVNPALGTIEQLADLATELRQNGISLVLDFIFNHTSNEHDWAAKAFSGYPEYEAFYRIYPDRAIPDRYEQTLREIFPDEHPGAFTYFPELNRWVWTTFHSFQWDLNYENPVVFSAMGEELLSIANIGVEVIRLDAVAFVWKKIGTTCENLPEAHMIIQAFNALARIAAPALLFKSEAIVHPDFVAQYIRPDECPLSYNPLLMALLWNSLATREVRLLRYSMQQRFAIDPGCAWVNYVRCHDDIGWTFSDEDSNRLSINGYDHRKFLNSFYTGRFPGSFATGLPFQENPKTGDCRISGSCASLAGLEKAVKEETEVEVDLAIQRILMIHSIILSMGGIPLIYLGDEIAILNDYSYQDDPAKSGDSRWVHRPFTDWKKYDRRKDKHTPEGKLFQALLKLIEIRKEHSVFASGEKHATEVLDVGNDHVYGYVRSYFNEKVIVMANFSEREQIVSIDRIPSMIWPGKDLVSGEEYQPGEEIKLEPYRFIWLSI
jgi:glycosidase